MGRGHGICQRAAEVEPRRYLGSRVCPNGPTRGIPEPISSVVRARISASSTTLLVIIYHVLPRGTTYQELGADFLDRLEPERLTRQLVKRLEALGHKVTLEACPAA